MLNIKELTYIHMPKAKLKYSQEGPFVITVNIKIL